jgi:hypothetical protein
MCWTDPAATAVLDQSELHVRETVILLAAAMKESTEMLTASKSVALQHPEQFVTRSAAEMFTASNSVAASRLLPTSPLP